MLIAEEIKPDTEKNGLKTCLSSEEMNIDNMIPALQEKIKAEADRYYREGDIGILEAFNEGSEEKEAVAHITDMTRQGNKVSMFGLVGSPLYIALYLHRYEEAEKILENAPHTAEPGYTARQFRVTFSPGKPDDGEIEFLTGGEVYLEEMLLTDTNLPDGLCIRLWNLWAQRSEEDQPRLFVDGGSGNEVPLLIREWPSRVKSRRRYGDLKHIDDRWFAVKHSREEYGPYHEAAKEDMERFWEGLKGLYRLKTLDRSLYESLMDNRLAAHLMVKFMMLLLQFVQLENMLLRVISGEQPMGSERYTVEELLRVARNAENSKMAMNPEYLTHIKQLQLTVDAAGALRKLKKGLEKLGFTNISGDTLWDACVDYNYDASDHTRVFWVAFQIWKAVYEGKLFLTMDGRCKERSERMWTALLYDDGWKGRKHTQNDIYMLLLRHLDGLQWTGNKDSEWMEGMRHAAGQQILRENDRELLLLTLEKNVLLAEDMDFIWKNYCGEDQLQLKPLLLLKKYGCL